MRLVPDEEALIARILEHIENRTSDRSGVVHQEPVENYLSAGRVHAEQELFRRTPFVMCPSRALPENGSFVAREVGGVPLLAARGSDGAVRLFKNACRHRGTQLAAAGVGCQKAFVCPYHGWAYALDGELLSIPHKEGFPGVDEKDRALAGVASVESGGLVWGNLGGAPGGEAAATFEPYAQALGLDAATLVSNGVEDVPINWKVLIEGFLEGYHIRVTHKETFYPYGYDNLNTLDLIGPHSRVTFPYKRIETQRALPPDQREIERMSTVVYQVFPNTVIAVLSYHITVLVFEPVAPAQTRLWNYKLVRNAVRGTDEQVARDVQFAQVGIDEDFAIGKLIQVGMQSGANQHHLFGHYEGAISHFHRRLTAAIGNLRS